jgi:hypothetical protein
MKLLYRDGQKLVLAEVDKFELNGAMITAHLHTSGEPEVVIRPFPDPEIAEDFFREIIAQPGDHIVNLENTAFSPRLGEMFDELDALYED